MRKDKTTLERARAMRREPTPAESKLWQALRNRQLNNFKFARQEPIGPYIADFVCRAKKLVIEIDGVTHETPEELAHDAARTVFLVREGYRVIRFSNEDIFGDLSPVLETIMRNLH
jgi:very-short-patch-repair endonuclease